MAIEPTLEKPITQSKVKTMMESTMAQEVDKLDTVVSRKIGKSLIAAMATLSDEQNLAFVRKVLKIATRVVQISIMKNEKVNKFLNAIMILKVTSPFMKRAVGKTLVKKDSVETPVARFVASQARKEVSEAAQQFIVIALLPPPSVLCELSSSDDD